MASHYFATLMRASGLAPPQAPAGLRPSAHAAVEEHALRDAEPQPDIGRAPLTPGLVRSDTASPAHEQEGDELPDPATQMASLATVETSVPRAAVAELPAGESGLLAGSPEPAPHTRAASEALRRSLMRVALQWVQTGPRQNPHEPAAPLPVAPDPQPALARRSASPAPNALSGIEPPRQADAPHDARTPPQSEPRPPRRPKALGTQPEPAGPSPGAVPWPRTPAPAAAEAAEQVEISIGAIHLRVEAPPARIAPPPAPAAPAAGRPAPRAGGDFERRLLRHL